MPIYIMFIVLSCQILFIWWIITATYNPSWYITDTKARTLGPSARARIMAADFAAETAEMTKAQVLQQAGVAMLAQANMLAAGSA